MGGVFLNNLDVKVTVNNVISSPVFITNKIITNSVLPDQIILNYTPTSLFYLQSFSVYVWDLITSSQVIFGEFSLESPPGVKLYTAQLTSMGGGKEMIEFVHLITFQIGITIQLVCSPSAPINNQTWQANLIGGT